MGRSYMQSPNLARLVIRILERVAMLIGHEDQCAGETVCPGIGCVGIEAGSVVVRFIAWPWNLPAESGGYGQLSREFDLVLEIRGRKVVPEFGVFLRRSPVGGVNPTQQETRELVTRIAKTRQLGLDLVEIEGAGLVG